MIAPFIIKSGSLPGSKPSDDDVAVWKKLRLMPSNKDYEVIPQSVLGYVKKQTFRNVRNRGDVVAVVPESFLSSLESSRAYFVTQAGRNEYLSLLSSVISKIAESDQKLRDSMEYVLNRSFDDSNPHARKTSVDEFMANPARYPIVMAISVIRYLQSNRTNRDKYNDILMAAILARENVTSFSKGDEIFAPFCFVSSNSFNQDLDYDSNDYTALAVGLGQMHPKRLDKLKSLVDYHNQNVPFDVFVTLSPWWFQILLMSRYLAFSMLNRTRYVGSEMKKRTRPISDYYYRYYLAGQPSLARLEGSNPTLIPYLRPITRVIKHCYLPQEDVLDPKLNLAGYLDGGFDFPSAPTNIWFKYLRRFGNVPGYDRMWYSYLAGSPTIVGSEGKRQPFDPRELFVDPITDESLSARVRSTLSLMHKSLDDKMTNSLFDIYSPNSEDDILSVRMKISIFK